MLYLALVACFVLILGLAVLWWGRRAHDGTGMPVGEVISTDMGGWRAQDQPLISRRYGLVGKPDYLVDVREKRHSVTIPVEVKSRRKPAIAYDSHVLQLATYCLLVEDVYKRPPPYGYLRYADATLKVPFTNDLRRQVLAAADAIRGARQASNVSRPHEDGGRCMGSGYRHGCGEQAFE